MVQTAESKLFTHFCLTEHMPRLHDKYLYPEELEKSYNKSHLLDNFNKYLVHAFELQKRVNSAGKMKILVGFEVEGIDQEHIDASIPFKLKSDMCVGSVHYVNGIPIDFNTDLWLAARDSVGGTRSLYKAYFELQFKVLKTLDPHVVGHFDLIRLFEVDDLDPSTGKKMSAISVEKDWPEVWEVIVRNIKYVASYGGLFELNSAAIRKGWTTPYPRKDMAQAIIKYGGKFCLSDDSHAYTQVGLNYHKVWEYVQELELGSIYHLDLKDGKTVVVEDSVEELTKSSFWDQYREL